MVPGEAEEEGRPPSGPVATSDATISDPNEIAKLSKKDQQILQLRREHAGQRKIGEAVKLSRTQVRNRVNALVMRGFLSPAERIEEAEEKKEPGEEGGGKAVVTSRAIGQATAEAARQAADMAVETTDVFMKTGEWAWRVFNERARALGYAEIFSWLGDCVEYWETEREGWQPILEDLRAARQENDLLRAKAEYLTDLREFRKEVLEAVLMSNLSGTPMTGEQLSVLVLGRAPPVYPAGPVRVLPPG